MSVKVLSIEGLNINSRLSPRNSSDSSRVDLRPMSDDADLDPEDSDSWDNIFIEWDRQPEVSEFFKKTFGLDLVYGSETKIIPGYNDRNEEFEDWYDFDPRPTTYDELEERFQSDEHRGITDLLRTLAKQSGLNCYGNNVGVAGVGSMADMVFYNNNKFVFVEVQSAVGVTKPERLNRKLLLASKHPTAFVVGLFTNVTPLVEAGCKTVFRADMFSGTIFDALTPDAIFECPSCGSRESYSQLKPHVYPRELPDCGPVCSKCESDSSSWHEKVDHLVKQQAKLARLARIAKYGCWECQHHSKKSNVHLATRSFQ